MEILDKIDEETKNVIKEFKVNHPEYYEEILPDLTQSVAGLKEFAAVSIARNETDLEIAAHIVKMKRKFINLKYTLIKTPESPNSLDITTTKAILGAIFLCDAMSVLCSQLIDYLTPSTQDSLDKIFPIKNEAAKVWILLHQIRTEEGMHKNGKIAAAVDATKNLMRKVHDPETIFIVFAKKIDYTLASTSTYKEARKGLKFNKLVKEYSDKIYKMDRPK